MRLFSLPSQPQKAAFSASRHDAPAPSRRFAGVLGKHLSAAESPSPKPARYVVKAGETLSSIASTLKTHARAAESVPALVARLASLNRLPDPDALAVGQTLDLPSALAPRTRPEAGQRPPARVQAYGQAIAATARRLRIDPALSLAVARAESGLSAATATEVVLNPRAVSQDGKSAGLFQLTSETGKAQLQKLALRQAYNPFNPRQSIHLGVSYLKYLSTAFSTETTLHQDLRTTPGATPQEVRRLAVAAYNAGEGRVARAQLQAQARGGNPARYQDVAPYLPETTQSYVERVERFAAEL